MEARRHYARAIKQVEARMNDIKKRGSAAIGENALEFMDSFLTKEEIEESNLRVAIMEEIIDARKEKGISQKRLEELSGVKQPVIARMERGATSPQLDTVLKLLAPLGKTLAVVPMQAKRQTE